MNIGIIGGGSVGQTLGAGLQALGHQVTIGIRIPSEAELAKPRDYAKPLADWVQDTGGRVATSSPSRLFFSTSDTPLK